MGKTDGMKVRRFQNILDLGISNFRISIKIPPLTEIIQPLSKKVLLWSMPCKNLDIIS